MLKLPQNLTTLILGVLVVNVIGLWTVHLMARPDQKYDLSLQPTPAPQSQASVSEDDAKRNLVATEAGQLAELKQQLTEVAQAVATLAAEPRTTQNINYSTTKASLTAKEYVVYLGNGSTTSREWTELEGTKITLDANNYQNIKNIEFQASLNNHNGEARARLKNKTTGAVFHETEVMHGSSTAVWKTASFNGLHVGSNEYVVEFKSTSGELATLAGARLKIVLH